MGSALDNSTTSATKKDHPFFRHCEKQTEIPVEGTIVSGKIPLWLKGSLIRNGPGIQKVGDTHYNHLFDGLAILHKFEIKNGKAFYQSRALESEAYQKNFAANRIVVGEFGTTAFPDPCLSLFGKVQAKFESMMGKSEMEMSDNCSVNVGYYGDQLYAMTETVFIRRIDPESLKCIGDKTRIRDYCVLNTATAHPHQLEDGSMLNVGGNYRNPKGPHYCFVKVPPKFGSDETAYKEAKIVAEIPSRWKFNPCYFHSFGMTRDKIIFVESPLCLDVLGVMSKSVLNNSFEECVKWHGSEKTRLHVVSMVDGKPVPITYETDAFFTFHHINAYQEGDNLIVDVAAYNDAEILKDAKISAINIKDLGTTKGATGRRFILPLNIAGAKPGENLVNIPNTTATAVLRIGSNSVVDVTPHNLTSEWVELPRINYKLNGKMYKYFYAIGSNKPGNYALPHASLLTKNNVIDGTTITYDSKGLMVSEPVFVSDPTKPDGEEDDGVILAYVIHDDPRDVNMVILDAKDMTEISNIKFKAEGTVTSTFHGIWTHSKK